MIEHLAGSLLLFHSLQVLVVQTVGSSGAVRLGAELLKRYFCVSSSWAGDVLLSSPCDGVYNTSIGIKVQLLNLKTPVVTNWKSTTLQFVTAVDLADQAHLKILVMWIRCVRLEMHLKTVGSSGSLLITACRNNIQPRSETYVYHGCQRWLPGWSEIYESNTFFAVRNVIHHFFFSFGLFLFLPPHALVFAVHCHHYFS